MIKAGHTIYFIDYERRKIESLFVRRAFRCGQHDQTISGIRGNTSVEYHLPKCRLSVAHRHSLEKIYLSRRKAEKKLAMSDKAPVQILIVGESDTHARIRTLLNRLPDVEVVDYEETDEQNKLRAFFEQNPQVLEIRAPEVMDGVLIHKCLKHERQAQQRQLRREGRGINYRK